MLFDQTGGRNPCEIQPTRLSLANFCRIDQNMANLPEDSDFAVDRQVPSVLKTPVDLADIEQMRKRALIVLETARARMLEPKPRKIPPTYTSGEVAELCGITRKKLNYYKTKPNSTLPKGSGDYTRVYTLAEAREWVRTVGANYVPRPAGKRGKVVCVCNFKGGSAKTVTTVALAHGLSLRHARKVLLVDLDSQASATILNDVLPDREVPSESTIMPFFQRPDVPDLSYAVRDTYWDGVSLIPSSYPVYELEVQIPILAFDEKDFDFWDLLREGLEPLRDEFDVIVIDTPPSLSYLTFNALHAADALVIPTPTESLDFASSVMFWKLFGELYGIVAKRMARRGETLVKTFDFVNVLLSKVNARASGTESVRQWILAAYTDKVLPIAIPLSETASSKSSEFGSVYDGSLADQDPRAIKRIRERMNDFVDLIDKQIVDSWTLS